MWSWGTGTQDHKFEGTWRFVWNPVYLIEQDCTSPGMNLPTVNSSKCDSSNSNCNSGHTSSEYSSSNSSSSNSLSIEILDLAVQQHQYQHQTSFSTSTSTNIKETKKQRTKETTATWSWGTIRHKIIQIRGHLKVCLESSLINWTGLHFSRHEPSNCYF